MTSYAVHFDRIGRGHHDTTAIFDVPDEPAATHADRLAEVIFDHAKPKLLSRDVEVVLDVDEDTHEGNGIIACGFHAGGRFTIEPAR